MASTTSKAGWLGKAKATTTPAKGHLLGGTLRRDARRSRGHPLERITPASFAIVAPQAGDLVKRDHYLTLLSLSPGLEITGKQEQNKPLPTATGRR